MSEHRAIEDLMESGAGRPAPGVVTRLYIEAFARFGTSTRREGGLRARPLAAQIEDACRASL